MWIKNVSFQNHDTPQLFVLPCITPSL